MSKSPTESKVFFTLVVIIGFMGAWILKLGRDLVDAQNRIPPVIVTPTVALKVPTKADR